MRVSRAWGRSLNEFRCHAQKHLNDPMRTSAKPELRRITSNIASNRKFSTSATRSQDDESTLNQTVKTQHDTAPGSTAAQPSRSTSTTMSPRSSATPRPSESQPAAIDLSTISSNPKYQAPKRPEPREDKIFNSIKNLLQDAKAQTNQNTPPSRFNKDMYRQGALSQTPRNPTPNLILQDLQNSKLRSAERSGYGELTANLGRDNAAISLRLKPTLGKTFKITDSATYDLTRAFQTLEAKINGKGNSVRREERAQKFHVRRGQARKIEKRARWRALFKQGYLSELARVRKMIKHGW